MNPCPKCGTNGAHYCPADLCGPDEVEPTTCIYCDKPEWNEGSRRCEQCAASDWRDAEERRREERNEAACDARFEQMKDDAMTERDR